MRRDISQDSFTRFANDMDWIEAHYDELRALYPDQYVAVVNGNVVAHDPTISGVLAQLRPVYGAATSELAIKFIYKETPAIVL
jgi:hypothetical protein